MLYYGGDYWVGTRHPWSSIVFVLPLLAIYEMGLHSLGALPATELRNGADVWLRAGLERVGVAPVYGAPVALVLILLIWMLLYRQPRPTDPIGLWIGMTLESVLFAALFYAASHAIWPMLHSLSGILEGRTPVPALLLQIAGQEVSASNEPEPAIVHLVRFFGAGIYEEALFRLGLFSGLLAFFNVVEMERRWGILLAGIGSALVFAGAHNLLPHGEPFQAPIFLFRTLAGIYFAWLYCIRGFGVAVGAHAGYDVLAGLLAR